MQGITNWNVIVIGLIIVLVLNAGLIYIAKLNRKARDKRLVRTCEDLRIRLLEGSDQHDSLRLHENRNND